MSEQAVRTHEVELRDGETIYVRIGDLPIVAAAAIVLLLTLTVLRPRASASPDRR